MRRRPLTRLAVLGLAGHLAFELGARTGLPGSGVVGAGPAAAGWTSLTAGTVVAAGRAGPGADRVLRFVPAVGLGAVLGHLAGWPRRRGPLGLPWLVDCEGLGPDLMRWYNPLLHVPGAVAVAALAAENRSAARWPAVALAVAMAPALVPLQHRDLARRRRRAADRPDRWHARLQPSAGVSRSTQAGSS